MYTSQSDAAMEKPMERKPLPISRFHFVLSFYQSNSQHLDSKKLF